MATLRPYKGGYLFTSRHGLYLQYYLNFRLIVWQLKPVCLIVVLF
jgi:hypothetical protein